MVLPESLTHLREQWIVRGLRQIRHVNKVRLHLAASSANSDQAHAMGHGPSSHRHLGTDLITGVNHGIEAVRQKILTVFCCDEFIHGVNKAFWVDVRYAGLHGQHLGLTQGICDGMQLSVDVGL